MAATVEKQAKKSAGRIYIRRLSLSQTAHVLKVIIAVDIQD